MSKVIIDVREPYEYASGHVEGAMNIPPSQFLGDLRELKDIGKDEEIIVYCISGSRSNVVMHILQDRGYTNVKNGINKDQVAAKIK